MWSFEFGEASFDKASPLPCSYFVSNQRTNQPRGEYGSDIPVGYQVRIVQIPVFSDTDSGIFIFGTDTGNTRILKLRIRIGYGAMTTR
jgi:hypothetical protein